jgi:hypothetical protein
MHQKYSDAGCRWQAVSLLWIRRRGANPRHSRTLSRPWLSRRCHDGVRRHPGHAIAILGRLYHAEGRLPVVEPDALLMLLVIGGGFVLVFQLS